jgi:hypothetical protein
MQKEPLKQAWKEKGERLSVAYKDASGIDRLEAAAALNRFLDHPRDLARLDADIEKHLLIRDPQREWRVQGYDRIALETQRQRLANEYQWFMEYRRDSGLSPVYPDMVRHGAHLSELTADGHGVVTRWNTETLSGLIGQTWTSLKADAPKVAEQARDALAEFTPNDETLFRLCVNLNQAAASGIAPPLRGAGLGGRMGADVWGELASQSAQAPAAQVCRIAYPWGAPLAQAWQEQAERLALDGGEPQPLRVQATDDGVVVDVPTPWLATHALADELARQVVRGEQSEGQAMATVHRLAAAGMEVEPTWSPLRWPAASANSAFEGEANQNVSTMSEDRLPAGGAQWLAASPMLSLSQKMNFTALRDHFEPRLARLSPDDRELTEAVMALHYLDEVAVHGGLEQPIGPSMKDGQMAKSMSGTANTDATVLPEWPEALHGQRAALNGALSEVWSSQTDWAEWSSADRQRLEAHALHTAVQHRLGPSFSGAWRSANGERVGMLDSTGVFRDFAVADAMQQDAQSTLQEVQQMWASAQREVTGLEPHRHRGAYSGRPPNATPPSGEALNSNGHEAFTALEGRA